MRICGAMLSVPYVANSAINWLGNTEGHNSVGRMLNGLRTPELAWAGP